MKTVKRTLAFVLAAMMLASMIPTVGAADQIVTITDEKEFLDFAKACTRDVWSLGVTAELQNDLDFTGMDITPVPLFQGTFHGNGHVIRGVFLDQKGSKMGLFRSLTESAVVEDLIIEGDLHIQGTAESVGMLAGENQGTIRRCTTRGSVNGQENTGGVAGFNGESGTLEECTNQALLVGISQTGGITGENLGTVKNCSNEGDVNVDPDQKIPMNVGGIAGRSRGYIEGCGNSGAVGYNHLGYNIGGIVGLQTGETRDCVNAGMVSGRKDVGGIAGQMEPIIKITSEDSPLDDLNQNLGSLLEQMKTYVAQIDSMLGQGAGQAQVIYDSLENIHQQAHQAEGLPDVKEFAQQLHQKCQILADVLDGFCGDMDEFLNISAQDIELIKTQVQQLQQILDEILGQSEEPVCPELQELRDTLTDIQIQVQTIQDHMSAARQEMQALKDFIAQVVELAQQGTLSPETAPAFPGMDPAGHREACAAAIELLRSDLQKLPGQWEAVKQNASGELAGQLEQAGQAAAAIQDAMARLIQNGADFFERTRSEWELVISTTREIRALIQSFGAALQNGAQSIVDGVDEQIKVIEGAVEEMHQDFQGDHAALQDISGQMLGSLDQVRQAIHSLGEEPELTVKDQSGQEIKGNGVLSGCSGQGTVQGDSNVGGVLGAVSVELLDDPEATLQMYDIQLLTDTLVSLRATVTNCRFDGTVTVKNDYGGGIAGRCEAGAILDSAARGQVEVGTDYCGGIAGRSKGKILRCAALTDLTGGSWVGGIAGQGAELAGCRAIASADSSGEFQGAVAGEVTGELQDNCYLLEDLAGVDGVDYDAQAQGLSYGDFVQVSGIPEDFLEFSYRFVVDGQTVAEVPFSYGEDIELSQLPDNPVRDGQPGYWPDYPTDHLTRSLVLEARFEEPTDTLSWGGQIPELLAQGAFAHGAAITAQEGTVPEGTVGGASPVRVWEYQVTGCREDEVTLRIRCGESENPQAALWQGDSWQVAEAQQDGSYLVFTAPNSGKVLLLETPEAARKAPIYAGAAAAAIVLVMGLLHVRKKRKAAAAAKNKAENNEAAAAK